MATIAAMSWDVAESVFSQGYRAYQGAGPNARCPYEAPGDKRIGLWVAGKDAARKRIARDTAWEQFERREKAVM